MMKHWVAVAFLVAMPALASAPTDANVSGIWTLSAEVQGVTVDETCTLAQTPESKLTGSCDTSTGKYDVTGTVKDKTATFSHGGEYQGTKLVMTYTGKVGDDGAITGTLDVDPFSVTGSFTAKKGTATAPPAQ
jgi:hypothetical protein